jgi:6-phosphogluconolactonase
MIGLITTTLFYVGCYTDGKHPDGLHLVDVNHADGKIELRASHALDNPLYLAKSPDGAYLVAVERSGLAAFDVAPDGSLTKTDFVDLGAKALCHLSFMPSGGSICWAAYVNGESGTVDFSGGKFGKAVKFRHSGSGPNLPRQDAAHCHAAVPEPDGKNFTVVDLGLDALVSYPQGRISATGPAGAGPRHLVFHPRGDMAFVVFELGNRIGSYRWSAKDGFRMLDSKPTLPDGWSGYNLDAAIRFTPDMKRVVVSNRGYDSLSVFDFDDKTGALSFVNRSVMPGSWPRDFVFMPGTDIVLATMERSGTLLTLRYDASTGAFVPLSTLGGFHRPVAALPR